MKLVKFIGVIVVILIGYLLVQYDKENYTAALSNAFTNNNGESVESSVNYGSSYLTNEDNSDTNSLVFTNSNAYAVNLTADNIKINCIGTGSTKASDEDIAKNGFKVKVLFSRYNSNEKSETILVQRNEKVRIYITSVYESDVYPVNEVNCSYSLNIFSA